MSPKAKLKLYYEETAFSVVLRKNSLKPKCRPKILSRVRWLDCGTERRDRSGAIARNFPRKQL